MIYAAFLLRGAALAFVVISSWSSCTALKLVNVLCIGILVLGLRDRSRCVGGGVRAGSP